MKNRRFCVASGRSTLKPFGPCSTVSETAEHGPNAIRGIRSLSFGRHLASSYSEAKIRARSSSRNFMYRGINAESALFRFICTSLFRSPPEPVDRQFRIARPISATEKELISELELSRHVTLLRRMAQWILRQVIGSCGRRKQKRQRSEEESGKESLPHRVTVSFYAGFKTPVIGKP